MRILAMGAAVLAASVTVAGAGLIERACNKSDRDAATRGMCGCIQDVADMTLSNSDQRLAAKFFKNPGMAQEIRQSDRRGHEVFWKKYKNFGETAQTFCG